MVFRRRDPRPLWVTIREAAWPRGGWARAASYVGLRLKRLPDTPEKVARGVAAGVFVAFTPFYGLHFLIAALLALAVRGNVLAAIIGTFVNNVLTAVPIAALSIAIGSFLLGVNPDQGLVREVGQLFASAAWDLWHNVVAIFTPARADWSKLDLFYHDAFLPYLVGGLVPGALAAAASYWLTVPLVRAYQAARRRRLEERQAALRARHDARDGTPPPV